MNAQVMEVVDAQGRVVNTIVLAPDAPWLPPAGHSVRPRMTPAAEPVMAAPPMELTQLDFLRRFSAQERISIRASDDPVVMDFLHLLSMAKWIRLDDADTLGGLAYLEHVGLLASGRAEAILAG